MKRCCLLFILTVIGVWGALGAGEPLGDLTAINQRADTIMEALSRTSVSILPSIKCRDNWEPLLATKEGERVIQAAEKYLNEPIISCPEDVYKEYFSNGNRSRAQHLLFERYHRFYALAFAELMESKGRFLPALEETLCDFCSYPSWVLPAHDPDGKVYDGKLVSADLYSTELGGDLAALRQALLPVLSEETSALLAETIRSRVLVPYETSVRQGPLLGMWWVTSSSNWNAVCHCGTTMAALALCDDVKQKAWYLACAEYFTTKYYLSGFTPDGYCGEGIDYWNYGFGKFGYLAELSYRATGGEVCLYRDDRVYNTALYSVRSMLKQEFFPSIADCSLTARPDRRLTGLMSIRLGLGLSAYEEELRSRPIDFTMVAPLAVYYFQPEKFLAAIDSRSVETNDPLRGDFADAGVLICRPPQDESGTPDPEQLCAFFKGGNNNELHNHNDVGVYGILLGKNYLVVDPGAEIYTRRTFSQRRYEGELLNSYGHSIPRVNGALQIAGPNAQGKVVSKSLTPNTDTLVLDLSSAYPDQRLQSLTREFLFTRADVGSPNEVTVTDKFVFEPEKEGTFESPLVTFARWTVLSISEDRSVYTGTLSKGDDTVEVTVRGTSDGQPLPLEFSQATVAENDDSVRDKPERIAFTARGTSGEIGFSFRPFLTQKTEKE